MPGHSAGSGGLLPGTRLPFRSPWREQGQETQCILEREDANSGSQRSNDFLFLTLRLGKCGPRTSVSIGRGLVTDVGSRTLRVP